MNWTEMAFRVAMGALALWYCFSTWREASAPLPPDAPEDERRPIFVKARHTRQARLDFGLGITSVFTAIGMASLAQDLVDWRDFFANFLENLLALFRFVFDLLPFHVPDAWIPLISGLLGVLGLMARYNVVLIGAGLSDARDAISGGLLLLCFTVLLGIVMLTVGSVTAQSSLTGLFGAMFAIALLGAIRLRSPSASVRLEGFYGIQAVGWCLLWGLVIIFLGSKGLRVS